MKIAPIVLFVYNRPWHTQQTVEALQQNELAKESDLYIYSDAPRDESAKYKVSQVRKYIHEISGFRSIYITERATNWGLATNIIDGVTEIVNTYGIIIVLEDDLVTSPYFLKFMNEALYYYKDEKRVWEIGAYVYPINVEYDFFFTHYTTSWGWATWNDRWKHFERNSEKLVHTMKKEQIKRFNLENSDDLWSQVIRNQKGTLYTWAVFWYATVFQNNGFVLYPKQSLVQNIGHDGTGENCGTTNVFRTRIENKPVKVIYVEPSVSDRTIKQVKQYLRKNHKTLLKRLKRLINKFDRLFKK